VPRVLGDKLTARIDGRAWPQPPLFAWLQRAGNVEDAEMFRVFNCGIGLVLVLSPADASKAMTLLTQDGERVFEIGRIDARRGDEPQTVIA
jgi:phosphoribosylformylglycinamidine cyclo-ligase